MKIKNRVGNIIGRLTVLSYAGSDDRGEAKWNCICDCGKQVVVLGSNLQSKHTQSCGCLALELLSKRTITHGQTGTVTYRAWESMKDRCSRENNPAYKNYGGRGIRICKRWLSFENFYMDMGEKPGKMTLDRINNSRGYSPDNCRWATYTTQGRNKRNNHLIKYQNEEKCLSAWAEELGVKRATLYSRLQNHSPQIAFNM